MVLTAFRDKDGYIRVTAKGHPRAMKLGHYVYEHIIVYEYHHKCCVLEWGVVHHKNKIRDDNDIENLECMMKGKHSQHHNLLDQSNRRCTRCQTNKTVIRKDLQGQRPQWRKDKETGLILCNRCYAFSYYHKNKKLNA